MSGNLAAMAKEVDNAQKKADKLSQKGGKAPADKVAAASLEVENANNQWESQAPYIFEKLQEVDESRLNHLRDVLTQFEVRGHIVPSIACIFHLCYPIVQHDGCSGGLC